MRILKSEKGIGTVVASIMFLLITILFIGGTFLWQSTNEAHMNAFEKDRMDEAFSVEASYHYTNGTGPLSTQLKVKNTGPIDIQIIQAWIIDADNNDHKHVTCYYPIPVDSFEDLAEIDALNRSLTYPLNVNTTIYYFKVVTERGNIASSRMMPRAAFISNWPAVIVPEASWVKNVQSGGHIHLVVYNKLDDDIHIALIVASRLQHGSEHSEVIYIEPEWILEAGAQEEKDIWGSEGQIYMLGEIVFIELADTDGIVISSYYFTCQ